MTQQYKARLCFSTEALRAWEVVQSTNMAQTCWEQVELLCGIAQAGKICKVSSKAQEWRVSSTAVEPPVPLLLSPTCPPSTQAVVRYSLYAEVGIADMLDVFMHPPAAEC